MTGFGDAQTTGSPACYRVEVRSVNNRHFKLHYRGPDELGGYEADVERLVRQKVSRGTVSVSIRPDTATSGDAARINEPVLLAYWQQLQQLSEKVSGMAQPSLADLLPLPGVISDRSAAIGDVDATWEAVSQALEKALAQHHEFRVREGHAMAVEIESSCDQIRAILDKIVQWSSDVIAEYRDKLLQRIQTLLANTDVSVDPRDLLREVSLFADRCDINEEITRLRAHLDQFKQLLSGANSQGRKLDFLCQELFRESNTIGSKSNHLGISHAAVDMKTEVERIREIVQNLE
jgi:uncharacterized protein (TIGR00255 family)